MSNQLASIGERFTAQFLDSLVALGVGLIAYFVAITFQLSIGLAALGWFIYLLICDGFPGGQSLGKRFTNSSVVHVTTGLPCSYWQSVVRNLCLFVLGFIDWIFIIGSQRRRLGDFLARTKVVQLSK